MKKIQSVSAQPEVFYKPYLNTDELRAYLGVGRDTAKKLADRCGAARKIGTRVIYDRAVIDAAVADLKG